MTMTCDKCHGTGSVPNGTDWMACRSCGGTGQSDSGHCEKHGHNLCGCTSEEREAFRAANRRVPRFDDAKEPGQAILSAAVFERLREENAQLLAGMIERLRAASDSETRVRVSIQHERDEWARLAHEAKVRAEAAERALSALRWQVEQGGCAVSRDGETTYECRADDPCGLCRLRARTKLDDVVRARNREKARADRAEASLRGTPPAGVDSKLKTALTAWAAWYSARLTRIAQGAREDYTGHEQDLFEALGCSTSHFEENKR